MKFLEIAVKENEEKILPFIFIDKQEDIIVEVKLIGENARVHIVGLFLGTDASQKIFNTVTVHKAPHTKSRITIRGVFLDKSSFANDGLVRIEKGAKGADGFFSSKILLFDQAKGRSVPSLEIDENEVKAGHASTVGRPDPLHLFYLQSRGLGKKQAEMLIVSGFFEPAIKFLPLEKQKMLRRKIQIFSLRQKYV